jgi:hypothetical protein
MLGSLLLAIVVLGVVVFFGRAGQMIWKRAAVDVSVGDVSDVTAANAVAVGIVAIINGGAAGIVDAVRAHTEITVDFSVLDRELKGIGLVACNMAIGSTIGNELANRANLGQRVLLHLSRFTGNTIDDRQTGLDAAQGSAERYRRLLTAQQKVRKLDIDDIIGAALCSATTLPSALAATFARDCFRGVLGRIQSLLRRVDRRIWT